MIALEHVTKAYGGRDTRRMVLSDLSAVFDGTQDVGILGTNGSGKSTLLRLIAGMDRPDSGRIIRDQRVSFPIGFSGSFHPHLSARDNVRFMARMFGMDVRAMVNFVQDFAEIGDYYDRPVSTFSSSMRARVSFAASIAIEADVYLVDEVTAVGDALFKRKCMAAFAERRRNAKIIMVSQAITTIGKICQRGAILDGGQLRMFETMSEAIAAYEDHMAVKNDPFEQ